MVVKTDLKMVAKMVEMKALKMVVMRVEMMVD